MKIGSRTVMDVLVTGGLRDEAGLTNYAVDGLVVIPAAIAGLIVGAITEMAIQMAVPEPAT